MAAAGSGIRSRGRRGNTSVPNWRWEDDRLDPYDLRVAGWLVSHADGYVADHVSLTKMSEWLGMASARARKSLDRLLELGIVYAIETGARGRLVIGVDLDVWEGDRPTTTRGVTHHHVAGDPPPRGGSGDLHLPMTETQVGEQLERACDRPARRSMEPAVDVEALFDAFWRVYPRPLCKQDARKAFVKLVKAGVDMREVGAGLRAWCAHWDARGESQFIPYPATWLNRRQWETPPVDSPARPTVVERVRSKVEFKREHLAQHGCDETCAEVAWNRHQRRRPDAVDARVVG